MLRVRSHLSQTPVVEVVVVVVLRNLRVCVYPHHLSRASYS